MRRVERSAGALLLATGAAILPACGGDSVDGPPPPPPTTTPPAVTTVVSESSQSGLEQRTLLSVVFSTSQVGSLTATVDWTFATDNVEAYLTSGNNPCTIAQFNNGTCPFVAVATSATAKPERLTANGQVAGAYTLYIGNRGPKSESVSWQVTLTTGGAASATTAKSYEIAGPFERITPVSE